jgi:hypothetical protein
LARILQGLGPIPETTTWKQLNAFKNSFSCDFNKNTTLLPSFYRWLLVLQRRFQDSTTESTTMDDSSSYGETLKSGDKFSKDPKDCTTSFSRQMLT